MTSDYLDDDFMNALETLLDALAMVQWGRRMSNEVFLPEVKEFFGAEIHDSYCEWMDIKND